MARRITWFVLPAIGGILLGATVAKLSLYLARDHVTHYTAQILKMDKRKIQEDQHSPVILRAELPLEIFSCERLLPVIEDGNAPRVTPRRSLHLRAPPASLRIRFV